MSDFAHTLSEQAASFTPGTYRHFKGDLYEALMVARSSEDRSQEFVVYRSLDQGHVWVRPLEMFFEEMDRDGYQGPRFQRVEKE